MRTGLSAALLATSIVAGAGIPAGRAAAQNEPPFQTNVLDQARKNTAYRRVIDTGARSQLVVMSIPPGGDIGQEEHGSVEQTLVCVSGHGQAVLDGREVPFEPGDVVVVTPGTRHDFKNVGKEPLKLYTIYTPPNHLRGRVQATKSDAEKDTADQKFGETAD